MLAAQVALGWAAPTLFIAVDELRRWHAANKQQLAQQQQQQQPNPQQEQDCGAPATQHWAARAEAAWLWVVGGEPPLAHALTAAHAGVALVLAAAFALLWEVVVLWVSASAHGGTQPLVAWRVYL